MSIDLDPESRELLTEIQSAGTPPVTGLSIAEGRQAMEALLANRTEPEPVARVTDLEIPGADTPLTVRLYDPDPDEPTPIVVFCHGGGWVRGSIESHDALCRGLALAAGATIVSVEYRRPPEHPFPAPVEDTYAAVRWASENARFVGGDPDRLGVAGESAGATLAAATALYAREQGGPDLALQALLYPPLSYELDAPSVSENEGIFGTRESLQWYQDQYLRSEVDGQNPLAFPLKAGSFADLPATVIVTCELDMARDDGIEYAECLANDGVPVDRIHVDGVFHGFLAFQDLNRAQEITETVGKRIRERFDR
jgi:acetyl esterase